MRNSDCLVVLDTDMDGIEEEFWGNFGQMDCLVNTHTAFMMRCLVAMKSSCIGLWCITLEFTEISHKYGKLRELQQSKRQ